MARQSRIPAPLVVRNTTMTTLDCRSRDTRILLLRRSHHWKNLPLLTTVIVLAMSSSTAFHASLNLSPLSTATCRVPGHSLSHYGPRGPTMFAMDDVTVPKPKRFSASTTALHHTGHSHSHHHHYEEDKEEHDDDFIAGKKTSPTTKWIRRMAVWVCCWMATCGITLLKNKKLCTQDWVTFAVSALLVTSAQKMQRTFSKGMLRLQKVKEGVVKHSSFPSSNNNNNKSTTAQAVAAIRNTEEADRVTWMGVIINLLLSIGKLVVGIAQNSSVLIADAGHSLSDLVSDFITLWSVNVARLPPDDDHPYGHYKFEAIGSLFLSLTLLMTGVSVGLHSQRQLLNILKISHNAALSGATAAAVTTPGPLALVMAGLSIFSKEWLFRVTKVVGEKLNSPVVIANAWHHRSDAYSSILALLSIAWSMAGFPAADAAAGMLVAGMIGMTGGDILVESVKQLSDSAHEELEKEVEEVLKSMHDDDVLSTTSIRARQVGSASVAEVTVEVESALTTTATRAVEERIQQHLQKELRSENPGRSVVATVHAKTNLIVCPLLHQQNSDGEGTSDDSRASIAKTNGSSSSPPADEGTSSVSPSSEVIVSASQIEHDVRQQALLLYPKIHCQVTGVAVHFCSQKTVNVDCNILVDKKGKGGTADDKETNLTLVLAHAKELQSALEANIPTIESANIYLDLNQMTEAGSRSQTTANLAP